MKTVQFVCGHNAGRSQMAEAYFNHRNTNPECRALSSGTRTSSEVNPVVLKLLEREGVSTEGLHPKLVTEDMINAATEVYTMGCGVEGECLVGADIVDLALDDPHGQGDDAVESIYRELKKKLDPIIARWQIG